MKSRERLKRRAKFALMLRREGLTFAEIAKIMQIEKDRARTLVARGERNEKNAKDPD